MLRKTTLVAALAATASFGAAAYAQEPVELRFMWYSDGNEGDVMADLLSRFEEENPDIKVVLDNVAYTVIRDQLPVQLEAGQGPDLARVTTLKDLAPHWLDLRDLVEDASYWEENFGNYLDWMRPEGSDIIPGYMTQLTVTGPFVNRTLFEQAGVELPGEDATWDEWAEAVKQVAEDQQIPIPLAMDRSGHRFTGPAISMGAGFIGEDGMPAVIDDGFKAMAERIARWHEDGTMSPEIWGSVSGTTYRGANEEFANAEVVMYYSGSWQIAQFEETIGDAFDWAAVPNPCGPAACTGLPGGAGVVGIKYTEHPEEVARLIDWLASEPVLKEFYERTLFLPGHKGLTEAGLDYQSDNPNVKESLDTFVGAVGNLAPLANRMPSWEWANVVYFAIIGRLGQVVAGELSLEEAYSRIEDDIAQQVEEAQR
ncbi:ABC transporter substrate-binding protein [Chelativorans salis]|uniref:ABC transporter substrate-binding protein n=1 Tax=Chelativorans salis TaxID=2978478 RepID=A0ABT2LUA3_9HYPH|nr:ABC transporter substrate-binding protein [Chelativorans sp. EGI FJ00035]MCT7377654.1 ABC transporter substrate-binding protein [Chelativorans sp. EGI FJ00035]